MIGAGEDVKRRLEDNFGCKQYKFNNANLYPASGDTGAPVLSTSANELMSGAVTGINIETNSKEILDISNEIKGEN